MDSEAGRWHTALLDDEVELFADPRNQVRFAVHQHSVRHALLGALQAAFPLLRSRLGEADFAALAVAFIRADPPASPVMQEYGAGFADFIDIEHPLPLPPWCADLARLEWARREAFHAADSEPLALAELRAIALPTLLRSRFILGPSLRLLASPHPLFELWQGDAASPGTIDARAQAVQVWRHEGGVHVRLLHPGNHALLCALRRGRPLLQALRAAQAGSPSFDAGAALARLFEDRLIDGHLPPASTGELT